MPPPIRGGSIISGSLQLVPVLHLLYFKEMITWSTQQNLSEYSPLEETFGNCWLEIFCKPDAFLKPNSVKAVKMTHDPHDQYVSWPTTHDPSRLFTTAVTVSVTFAYTIGRGKEVAMWFRFSEQFVNVLLPLPSVSAYLAFSHGDHTWLGQITWRSPEQETLGIFSARFLQVGYPSCHPTNHVNALKESIFVIRHRKTDIQLCCL